MATAPGPAPNPYVGPRPFREEERGLFFGRSREVADLLAALEADRVVVLSGDDGAGKTSLLNAGLVPALRDLGLRVWPTLRVGSPPVGSRPSNRYIASTIRSLLAGSGLAARPGSAEDLGAALDSLTRRQPPVTPTGEEPAGDVLVFDQFEEVLTAESGDDGAKRAFFEHLGAVLDHPKRLAVFSVRERFLNGLEPFRYVLPNDLGHRLHLDLLSPEVAVEAVRGPARAGGVEFAPGAAERLVDDLRRGGVADAGEEIRQELLPVVSPTELQVICSLLWERLAPSSGPVTLDQVAAFGAGAAPTDRFAAVVAEVAARTGTEERAIREWLGRLTTDDGFRAQIRRETERSAGLDDRAIQALLDAHLVRTEARDEATWYELASDRLAEAVRADNATWFRRADPAPFDPGPWKRLRGQEERLEAIARAPGFGPAVVPRLLELLEESAPAGGLGRLVPGRSRERAELRAALARALGEIGDSLAAAALTAQARDPEEEPGRAAVEALLRIDGRLGLEALGRSPWYGADERAWIAGQVRDRTAAGSGPGAAPDPAILGRLSNSARSSLRFAEGVRRAAGVPAVLPEHLLAGLNQHPLGSTRSLLTLHDDGQTIAGGINELVDRVSPRSTPLRSVQAAPERALATAWLSPGVAAVLAEAAAQADAKGFDRVRMRHVLVGLLSAPESATARWIAETVGVDAARLRVLIAGTPDGLPPIEEIRRLGEARRVGDRSSPRPGSSAAELEVWLERSTDSDGYVAAWRLSLPGEETERRTEHPVRLDFQAMRASALDSIAAGRLLAESLFAADEGRDLLALARASDAPPRLRLVVGQSAPELHALPWETMTDPKDGGPLIVGGGVLFSRYVVEPDAPPLRLRPKGDLRALVAISAAEDVPPVDVLGQFERVRAELGEISVTRLEPVTIDGLGKALGDGYDILYLAGPWLEDEGRRATRLPVSAVASLLGRLPLPPRLVVFVAPPNAVPGNLQSERLNSANIGRPLVLAGIPAALVVQGPVSQDTVATFMPFFFRELLRDGQVDRAAAVARAAVRDRPDAWTPALFTRVRSGRLWSSPGPDGADGAPEFERWPALVDAIRERRCTPVLGPGLAEGLVGSRRDLARRWAASYSYPGIVGDQDDLPKVAQFLTERREPAYVRDLYFEAMREEVQRRLGMNLPFDELPLTSVIPIAWRLLAERDPDEPHRVLADLPLPVYVTANPDGFLVSALQAAGKDPQIELYRWWDALVQPRLLADAGPDYRPTPDRPLVYHFLGHFSQPQSLVLTEDDYELWRITLDRGLVEIPSTVRVALRDRPLLILGLEPEDRAFQALQRPMPGDQDPLPRGRYVRVMQRVAPNGGDVGDLVEAGRQWDLATMGVDIYWGSVAEFAAELRSRTHLEVPEVAPSPEPAAPTRHFVLALRPGAEQVAVYGETSLRAELLPVEAGRAGAVEVPLGEAGAHWFVRAEDGLRVVGGGAARVVRDPATGRPLPVEFALRGHLRGRWTYGVDLIVEDPGVGQTRLISAEGAVTVTPPAPGAAGPAVLPALDIRVAPQPDLVLRVETALPDGAHGPRRLRYGLTNRLPDAAPGEDPVGEAVLGPGEAERIRAVAAEALRGATGLESADAGERLASLGAWLFDRLFPAEGAAALRTEIARAAGGDRPRTWLVAEDGVTPLPWELVAPHGPGDAGPPRPLGAHARLGRWVDGLGPPPRGEVPYDQVALVHPDGSANGGPGNGAQEQARRSWRELINAADSPGLAPVVRPETRVYALHLLRRAAEIAARTEVVRRGTDPPAGAGEEAEVRGVRLDLWSKRPVVAVSILADGREDATGRWLLPERALPFLRAGASAVVGPWWPTSEGADRAFWASFYDLLDRRVPLGEAVARSRLAAARATPDRPDWLAYTLFGDPRARPYRPEPGEGYAALACLEPDQPLRPDRTYTFQASLASRPPAWYDDRLMRVERLPTRTKVLFLAPDLQTAPPEPVPLRPEGPGLLQASVRLTPRVPGRFPLLVHFLEDDEYVSALQLVLEVGDGADGGVGDG